MIDPILIKDRTIGDLRSAVEVVEDTIPDFSSWKLGYQYPSGYLEKFLNYCGWGVCIARSLLPSGLSCIVKGLVTQRHFCVSSRGRRGVRSEIFFDHVLGVSSNLFVKRSDSDLYFRGSDLKSVGCLWHDCHYYIQIIHQGSRILQSVVEDYCIDYGLPYFEEMCKNGLLYSVINLHQIKINGVSSRKINTTDSDGNFLLW
jgi:hypothetical protein